MIDWVRNNLPGTIGSSKDLRATKVSSGSHKRRMLVAANIRHHHYVRSPMTLTSPRNFRRVNRCQWQLLSPRLSQPPCMTLWDLVRLNEEKWEVWCRTVTFADECSLHSFDHHYAVFIRHRSWFSVRNKTREYDFFLRAAWDSLLDASGRENIDSSGSIQSSLAGLYQHTKEWSVTEIHLWCIHSTGRNGRWRTLVCISSKKLDVLGLMAMLVHHLSYLQSVVIEKSIVQVRSIAHLCRCTLSSSYDG